MDKNFATALLAQLVEHRTAAREVEGLNPGGTNTQGPKLTGSDEHTKMAFRSPLFGGHKEPLRT